MSRILVVDDEDAYRRHLQLALSNEGHEVKTAANGREAIDMGTRLRPDVLLTDWMLRDDIHGLHVVQVLHAVWPDIRALLMTAFPSEHLRSEAAKSYILDFIEKPFGLERLHQAVTWAEHHQETAQGFGSLAVLLVNRAGRIVNANERATDMLATLQPRQQPERFVSLFHADAVPDLDAANDRWVATRPLTPRPTRWYVRSQEPQVDGSRLIVLQVADETRLASAGLIGMLLGFSPAGRTRWPFDQRVLVIDPDGLNRTWFVSILENSGAGCYAVENLEQGKRLLAGDPDLKFVLVDCAKLIPEGQPCVEQLRATRDGVVVVAVTDNPEREQAKYTNVDFFLPAIWRIEDLIGLLTQNEAEDE